MVGEVVRTVDLVLHLGVSSEAGVRRRRLASVGYVAGAEAGQPIVDELVRLEPDGRWRRVGSPRAMPERSLLKLQRVCDPDRLMEGIGA